MRVLFLFIQFVCKSSLFGSYNVLHVVFEVNFSSFKYNRSTIFGDLPNPAYLPVTGSPEEGCFEYLEEISGNSGCATNNTECTFEVANEKIMMAVFDDAYFDDTAGVAGFVKAADDSRAVIDFMHRWAPPSSHVTKPTCSGPYSSYAYNAYISALQTPENIIKDAEDREVTVNVGIETVLANATQLKMNLTGQNSESGITVNMINDTIPDLGPSTGVYSWSCTVPISKDLTAKDGLINWTAEILDTQGGDYNMTDNKMKATSWVSKSGKYFRGL